RRSNGRDRRRAAMRVCGQVTRGMRTMLVVLALIEACAASTPDENAQIQPAERMGSQAPSDSPLAESPRRSGAPREAERASATPGAWGEAEPVPLRRPIERPTPERAPLGRLLFGLPFRTPIDPPLGFTGKSSVLPSEDQSDPHFVPVEDRWR